jgi:hypothetical protein
MNAIIDCGIEPWSGQSKDYNVGIFCFLFFVFNDLRSDVVGYVVDIGGKNYNQYTM